ncbi:MAG TPA: hypothetical protein VN774_04535, partial [Candidatus Limnocylindrales bacterium]|nr:hypothetical protein [Candidatus Limnocylindrales bacterium]
MEDRKISKRPADKPIVHTGGRIFSDGSILELVRSLNGEVNLLSWNGKVAKIAGQFVRQDAIFVPMRVDPAILRSLHLPSNIAGYGSTRKLFTEISGLISRVTRA